MRFKQYLNEAKEPLKGAIVDLCKPFIRDFKDEYVEGHFIYRGMSRSVNGYEIIKSRKDRKPKLIHQDLHEYLDKLCEKLFGWKARSNGIFTGSKSTAVTFGNPCIFIPIGEYRFISTNKTDKIYTLYDKYNYFMQAKESWNKDRTNPYWTKKPDEVKEIDKETEEDEKYIINALTEIYKKHYSSKKLDLSNFMVRSKEFEAIFQCKKYIVVNEKEWKSVVEAMDEL